MAEKNKNIKEWAFAFLLAIPVFYLYALHFFYHDANHIPSGNIQWEHIVYMFSAKEYATGNAGLLYAWPIINNFQGGHVFFQPQIFALGYLWKFIHIKPGYIIDAFGFLFAVLTLKVVISIFNILIPSAKYKKLIIVLFCWGGGILSACGVLLNFFYFKGSFATLPNHIFYLDPGEGSWCLNFGRTLIYPLEAYYHFLFITCILFILQKRFLATFLLMLLLILSHPYTSIEIISIGMVWLIAEVFYFKNTNYTKTQVAYFVSAFFIYFIYYALVLGHIEVYREINKLNALDWNYKAWHFVPAYAIVWLLSFLCIKNIPALKKHFSDSTNRLFFWWGFVTFLLSVHGFAIKPEQPIHFTRGYVYAGFFLFSIPVLQSIVQKLTEQKAKGFFLLSLFTFIFLFDNITWFGLQSFDKNGTGVYYTPEQLGVINFFTQQKEGGIVIGNEKSDADYAFTSSIQLNSAYKGWTPHPFLTFDIAKKRAAVDSLLANGKMDEAWKNKNTYLYFDKNDSTLQPANPKIVFENTGYRIYKIN